MKVTEEQRKRISSLVKNREGLKFIMQAMMEPAQRSMFTYYDRECDAVTLIERLNANDIYIGIDVNSRNGMKYVSDSIKFFNELYEVIMEERKKIHNSSKTLSGISNAVDVNKRYKTK